MIVITVFRIILINDFCVKPSAIRIKRMERLFCLIFKDNYFTRSPRAGCLNGAIIKLNYNKNESIKIKTLNSPGIIAGMP